MRSKAEANLELSFTRTSYLITVNKSSLSSYYPHIWAIGLISRVFANGPGDLGSIAGLVIPKTIKIVLDATLLYTQYYKLGIKDKVEQSMERSSAHFYTSVS